MITEIDNFVLVGTAHVAKQSVKDIKDAILIHNPQVVAIELDFSRFKSLMSKNKGKNASFFTMSKEFGFSGALFAQLAGFVQKKAGKMLNVDPGLDMKAAYKIARENKIPTALIDQDIKITLKKFSRLKFRKKLSLFKSLFMSGFKSENKEKLNFDIRKGVPNEKVLNEILSIVEKDAPILYKILIEDRNRYMVHKLMQLREKHDGKIMAVVGAGHVKGMKELIEKEAGIGYSYTFNVNL